MIRMSRLTPSRDLYIEINFISKSRSIVIELSRSVDLNIELQLFDIDRVRFKLARYCSNRLIRYRGNAKINILLLTSNNFPMFFLMSSSRQQPQTSSLFGTTSGSNVLTKEKAFNKCSEERQTLSELAVISQILTYTHIQTNTQN